MTFAILFNSENLSKVLTHQESLERTSPIYPDVFFKHHADWYYVQGYINERGQLIDWAIIPAYVLADNYEYDPVKIQTDWDQIVKLKPSEPEARLPYKE